MPSDAIQWLFSLERLGMKFGLETMRALLAELGEPQRTFASVHVAGTNGKGSVTAMTAAGLHAAGHRTGRYTSPHLVRLEERFVIGDREVDPDRLAATVGRVREAVERLLGRGELEAPPTFFEITTATAFELFRAERVSVAVLEVGLGGRLDATNVVSPLVTAITTIDFDHQAQLGDTIEAIAREKAGIIKPGVPVVVGRLPGPARVVIEAVANSLHAPVIEALLAVSLESMRPALPGEHQRDNAHVALALLMALDAHGFALDAAARRAAIEGVTWPARLERGRYAGADVLIDAAHNPAGARALSSYVEDLGWTDATLVFAAMADKDAAGMLSALAPSFARIVCTTASSPRAAAAADLARLAAGIAGADKVEVVNDPAAALAHACALSPRVVVAGSIFLIGPLRDILR